MKKTLLNKVVGQTESIKEINKIFDIFINSECNIRPHFILTGESGSGKTLTIQTMCEQKDISFIEINAAQLTKEGTSGNSLSKVLSPLSNASTPTICLVDEFDKLFISGNNNSDLAHESTNGVQNEFLKVLEGNKATVFADYGKYKDIPIDNVLFIFAGAFNNEEDINLDRLRDFGVKTEFLGRVGLVYNLKRLTLEDLYSILESSPLLNMYIQLFKNIDKTKCIKDLKAHLEKIYDNNTLGARVINTMINQYFIKGKLEDDKVKEISFQKKLDFNS